MRPMPSVALSRYLNFNVNNCPLRDAPTASSLMRAPQADSVVRFLGHLSRALFLSYEALLVLGLMIADHCRAR